MTIRLSQGIGVSEEAIATFQDFLGFSLSEAVKKFLKIYDGAKPEPNIFPVPLGNDASVNRFIPLRSIPYEISNLRGVSKRTYPIAWAEGGNYIVVNEEDSGAVYFWDHELHEPLTRIANDFDSFLEQLMPFDIASVKLNSDQVKKVWIDPDFIEAQKNK